VSAVAGFQLTGQAALAARPQLVMRPTPALVAATALLALTAAELGQAIERAVEQNPALERVEQAACPHCGRGLSVGRCFPCGRLGRIPPSRSAGAVTAESPVIPTLTETLLGEVGPLLGRGDRRIAVYLLGSFDSRGFLDTTTEAAAAALTVEPWRVERVLRLIQETAPAGVAARDLRECLLLQLDRGPDHGPVPALARRIVADHLALLGHGPDGELARVLGVGRADVAAAREFIRTRLRPRPGLGLTSGPAAPPLVPDIAIRETGDGLAVELIERDRFMLTVSPAFEQAVAARLAPGEREMIRRLLLEARELIDRLEQRWRTMGRVAEATVARQREFVRHGASHRVPLTRAQVAEVLGVHESTVSRAVAGRSVLLPSGQVLPFALFFGRSSAPQDALAALVAAEERPKSDTELAGELAALGLVVARRTVAKYRDQLGILPSTLRRPAKRGSRTGPA
jgi:RNA polymerase sigma-54 factor